MQKAPDLIASGFDAATPQRSFRDDLLARRDELRVLCGNESHELRREFGSDEDWSPGEDDEGFDTTPMWVVGRSSEALRQVETAIRRLASGDFGICEECGCELPIERLEVLPETTLCVRCAT